MRAYACSKTKFERKSILKYYHLTYIVKHTSQSKRSVCHVPTKYRLPRKSVRNQIISLSQEQDQELSFVSTVEEVCIG